MTTPGPSPRVRRLPERAVLVEQAPTADAVEADPTALPPVAPVAAWRRWAWAVAFVPTVALLVYQRAGASRGWPVPEALVVVATLGLLLTAVLALVRYQDDRAAARLARGRDALLAAPVRATGTLTVPAPATDAPQPGAHGARGTLVVTTGSGVATARPVRVVVPAGTAAPRPGDPVAVWHAADDEDATGVLLVRYQRDWADDLLAALRGGGPAADDGPHPGGPDEPEDRTEPPARAE
ncbi:hypothetical protein [Cellulosimicrobium sp. JZ28]|uniref:hypothetical protein n=1 Tax=Cellulosimicrobium sp. JZ28 TaxID=1906273 RepID=UPI00188B66E8|nr:hypothetical protein [Cellulosimicrobium sp. JZ28]